MLCPSTRSVCPCGTRRQLPEAGPGVAVAGEDCRGRRGWELPWSPGCVVNSQAPRAASGQTRQRQVCLEAREDHAGRCPGQLFTLMAPSGTARMDLGFQEPAGEQQSLTQGQQGRVPRSWWTWLPRTGTDAHRQECGWADHDPPQHVVQRWPQANPRSARRQARLARELATAVGHHHGPPPWSQWCRSVTS